MPVPGDVDVVVCSELMEAGRAIQRGLVTPDRTTLVASTHRVFSMTERIAPPTAASTAARCSTPARSAAQAPRRRRPRGGGGAHRQRHQRRPVRGARPLGGAALLARGLRGDDRARRASASPRACGPFASGLRRGRRRAVGPACAGGQLRPAAADPRRARHGPDDASCRSGETIPADVPALVAEVEQRFPEPARAFAREGVARCAAYQDEAYARLYLDRLRPILALDRRRRPPRRRDRAPARARHGLRGHDPGGRAEDQAGALRAGAAGGEARPRASPGDRRVHAPAACRRSPRPCPPRSGRWLLRTPWASAVVGRFAAKGRVVTDEHRRRLPAPLRPRGSQAASSPLPALGARAGLPRRLAPARRRSGAARLRSRLRGRSPAQPGQRLRRHPRAGPRVLRRASSRSCPRSRRGRSRPRRWPRCTRRRWPTTPGAALQAAIDRARLAGSAETSAPNVARRCVGEGRAAATA